MSEIVGVSPEGGPLFAGLSGDILVSLEFFPPKSDAAAVQLFETVTSLARAA